MDCWQDGGMENDWGGDHSTLVMHDNKMMALKSEFVLQTAENKRLFAKYIPIWLKEKTFVPTANDNTFLRVYKHSFFLQFRV